MLFKFSGLLILTLIFTSTLYGQTNYFTNPPSTRAERELIQEIEKMTEGLEEGEYKRSLIQYIIHSKLTEGHFFEDSDLEIVRWTIREYGEQMKELYLQIATERFIDPLPKRESTFFLINFLEKAEKFELLKDLVQTSISYSKSENQSALFPDEMSFRQDAVQKILKGIDGQDIMNFLLPYKENKAFMTLFTILSQETFGIHYFLTKDLLTKCDATKRSANYKNEKFDASYIERECFEALELFITQENKPFVFQTFRMRPAGNPNRDASNDKVKFYMLHLNYGSHEQRLTCLKSLLEQNEKDDLHYFLKMALPSEDFERIQNYAALAIRFLPVTKASDLKDAFKTNNPVAREMALKTLQQIDPQSAGEVALKSWKESDSLFPLETVHEVILNSDTIWINHDFSQKIYEHASYQKILRNNLLKEGGLVDQVNEKEIILETSEKEQYESLLKFLVEKDYFTISQTVSKTLKDRYDHFTPSQVSAEVFSQFLKARYELMKLESNSSLPRVASISGSIIKSLFTTGDVEDMEVSAIQNLLKSYIQFSSLFEKQRLEDIMELKESVFYTMMEILEEAQGIEWPEDYESTLSPRLDVLNKYEAWLKNIDKVSTQELISAVSYIGPLAHRHYLSNLTLEEQGKRTPELKRLRIFKLKRLAILARILAEEF